MATYTAPALTVDTWYRRTVTSTLNGYSCSEQSPVILVTVNNFDPGSISADQDICEGDTPAAFTSVAPTGDGSIYLPVAEQSQWSEFLEHHRRDRRNLCRRSSDIGYMVQEAGNFNTECLYLH